MKLTEEEYADYCESYAGYCTHCDDVTSDSGVEPDAMGYHCPVCSGLNVMGIENALLMGKLSFVEENP